MATLDFFAARRCVLEKVGAGRKLPLIETVPLHEAAGRVLAAPITADRDYPPVSRSIRDGFALHSADVPGTVTVTGEVRAGARWNEPVPRGEAIEIMTGAPVPPGVDAVVMVEHVVRDGNLVTVDRAAAPGQFVNPQGAEARAGDVLLTPGTRLDYASVALLATVGCVQVSVFAQPRVAILATGDEIVEPWETPEPHQIRNSNVYSLAAQVRRAGGLPEILPVAPDRADETRALMERGLEADLLLLSGGVSAGKYDIVETVLAAMGAEFYFDRVAIQPGQPLVFGAARARFFFGLPGNPASTLVTFEVFARAALDLLCGCAESNLAVTFAPLSVPFRHKPGLTRFLPATLDANTGVVTPIAWQGSSDVPALARANVFIVVDAERESWAAGDLMRILNK